MYESGSDRTTAAMNLPYTVYEADDDAKECGSRGGRRGNADSESVSTPLAELTEKRKEGISSEDSKSGSGAGSAGVGSGLKEGEEKSYMSDAKSGTFSSSTTANVSHTDARKGEETIRYKDLFDPTSSPSKPGPGMQASPPASVTIQSPTHSSEAFSQTSKVRNLMNRFFAVKGDMELMIARLHNLLDELRILELSRSDAKRAVLQWNVEFAQLTGFSATVEDKQRSKVFVKLANRLVAAQNEFAAFHPKVAEFAEVTKKFYDSRIRPYTGEYETIAVHLHAAAVAEGSTNIFEATGLEGSRGGGGGVGTLASPTKRSPGTSDFKGGQEGDTSFSPASPDTRAAAASSLQQCLESLSIPTVPAVVHDDPYAL